MTKEVWKATLSSGGKWDVYNQDGRLIATGLSAEDADLIEAAPDMARAIARSVEKLNSVLEGINE